MLPEMTAIWKGSTETSIGPDVSADPPQLMIGGTIDAAYRRSARNRLPRRWTSTPPPGWDRSLTLDERLEVVEVMRDLHQQVG